MKKPEAGAGVLLHPCCFATVSHWFWLVQKKVVFEIHDHYQKQTYRNRYTIYGANGKQILSVPITHSGDGKSRKMQKVEINYSFDWQRLHWKSLETAYRSAPYFEFYEDELRPLFQKKHKFLLDFNFASLLWVAGQLEVILEIGKTETYHKTSTLPDARFLVLAKKNKAYNHPAYIQVFGNKHGFINDLSVLDLLFNLGPRAANYLNEFELPAIKV